MDGNLLQVHYPLSLVDSRDGENIETGSPPPADSVECENGDHKYTYSTRTPAIGAKQNISLYSPGLDIPGTHKQVGFRTFSVVSSESFPSPLMYLYLTWLGVVVQMFIIGTNL